MIITYDPIIPNRTDLMEDVAHPLHSYSDGYLTAELTPELTQRLGKSPSQPTRRIRLIQSIQLGAE